MPDDNAPLPANEKKPGWIRTFLRFLFRPSTSISVATLLVPDELGMLWRAETRNVAAGGMLVAGASDLQPDQSLHIYVHLEDGDVDARGRVVRVDSPDVHAVAFEAISGPDRLRIHREVLRARIAELKDQPDD